MHIYLYHKNHKNEYEFAVFQRADDPHYWQGISGGVEEGETVVEAALRESFEEAGVFINSDIYPLDTISYVPADVFSVYKQWGKNVVVCPMYFFVIPFEGVIQLSDEHLQVKWCTYQNAYDLIYWHDQKTALWELNQRLCRGNLIR